MAFMEEPPVDDVVLRRVSGMTFDPVARALVTAHDLDIMNVTWEDCANLKNSAWGPCISDMTLQVDGVNMPVIRQPNFADTTWDVPIESISIKIGNEVPGGSPLQTITLRQYLKNFRRYMTKPPKRRKKPKKKESSSSWFFGGSSVPEMESNLNLLVENGSSRDQNVIMSSQTCFLPVAETEETKFSVSLYNYASSDDNPAVLVIVSTSKGTAAQIITGGSQKLVFNDEGIKVDFVAKPLDDGKAKDLDDQEEMTDKEKDEVLVIIQVPLVHDENHQPDPFAGMDFYNDEDPWGGDGSEEYDGSEENLMMDVVPAIINVAPRTEVICKCSMPLQKRKAYTCYDHSTGQGAIGCDGCGKRIGPEEWVYHCDLGDVDPHKGGYDLCEECGEKELVFDELRGKKIQRDAKYPIRVTRQYYKPTSNGVINEEIMHEIAAQLARSRGKAEAIESLVVETTNSTTEVVDLVATAQPIVVVPTVDSAVDPVEQIVPTSPPVTVPDNLPQQLQPSDLVPPGYREVRKLLDSLKLGRYFGKFLEHEVTDENLRFLTDRYTNELIDKVGPRSRFDAGLVAWKIQNGF